MKKKDECLLNYYYSFTILFYYFSIADYNNGNDIIDFKNCFPHTLIIIEFLFFKLVMLKDSGMLDTFIGKNNIKHIMTVKNSLLDIFQVYGKTWYNRQTALLSSSYWRFILNKIVKKKDECFLK